MVLEVKSATLRTSHFLSHGLRNLSELSRFLSPGAVLFSFVRHPFDRLVSAFQDEAGGSRSKNGSRTDFAQFADLVLEGGRGCHPGGGGCSAVKGHWMPYNARYLKMLASSQPISLA